MHFVNNLFEILLEVVKEEYDDVYCYILIGDELTDGENTFGCTVFPEEFGDWPHIEIHPSLSVPDATEVLAHELAHVIAGKEADHNDKWESVFENINKLFNNELKSRYMYYLEGLSG